MREGETERELAMEAEPVLGNSLREEGRRRRICPVLKT